MPDAVAAIAEGYARVTADGAVERVLQRAIHHLLSADSPEVLEVRVPVACSGLELLSWAVLRRNGWIAAGPSRRQLPAAAQARLLLAWAGLEPELPDELSALAARRGRLGQPHAGGPELVFDVRNAVIHPPKSLKDPEWPSLDELIEAWQLSTMYLQLALLRLLDYQGSYRSRLRLDGTRFDAQPVPWAPPVKDIP